MTLVLGVDSKGQWLKCEKGDILIFFQIRVVKMGLP